MWRIEREDRDAFIDTRRPYVAGMLRELLIAGKPCPDPFLILAREDELESYVQCLLVDGGKAALCEAASGYYATKMGAPRELDLTARSKIVLRRLGFSISTEGNHQLRLELTGDSDFDRIAEVMLSAMFEVYGARASTPLLCRTVEQDVVLEDAEIEEIRPA